MVILALVLAVIAVACLLWAAKPHPSVQSSTNWVAVGLAFAVAAWVAQTVVQVGWHWVWR